MENKEKQIPENQEAEKKVTVPETEADKMNRAIRMAAGYLPVKLKN